MRPRSAIVRIGLDTGPWPMHDREATRAAEQLGAAALHPHALMQRAGLSVARLALALAPHGGSMHAWCGPGNNGGDGLVAARHLQLAGRPVRVSLFGDTARLPPDAALALQQAQDAGVTIEAGLPSITPPASLLIDALLGLGAYRAPEGDIAAAIVAINGHAAPVLAVDIPSGLQADTGALLGHQAVVATATLALLTLKPGCHTAQGRDHAGAVWLDTLGVDAGPPSAWLCGAAMPKQRRHGSHKGSYGDVIVVGGSTGMVGAAWLAASAASAAGAGRVICSPLEEEASLLDLQHPELMGRRRWWLSEPSVLAAPTVVCGCGGGQPVAAALPALLTHVGRLVLDADALNAIAGDPALASRLQARRAHGLHTILTPHPLEAARLLQTTNAAVQADRLRAAGELARRFDATVVLKGSGTVIAAAGQIPRINATGNGALATAGTGDVLAGLMGGLWAQHTSLDPTEIAVQAAALHGAAADAWVAAGRSGPLRASDLIESLGRR